MEQLGFFFYFIFLLLCWSAIISAFEIMNWIFFWIVGAPERSRNVSGRWWLSASIRCLFLRRWPVRSSSQKQIKNSRKLCIRKKQIPGKNFSETSHKNSFEHTIKIVTVKYRIEKSIWVDGLTCNFIQYLQISRSMSSSYEEINRRHSLELNYRDWDGPTRR